ncbi:ASCH domain-containing protein [Sphingobacterium siyangense]|uniref:ASCH domain-containing protein n=1 Tax=Sphingobacterium siyangense TaxID=459529 RepID=UPI003DA6762C
MKAASIKQPWASLIAHGIKDIENRTWATKYRGTIYIHASAKFAGDINNIFTDDQWEAMGEDMRSSMVIKDFPFGAIIGKVDIVDCVINHPSIWAEKSYHNVTVNSLPFGEENEPDYIIYNWVLANPVLFDEPILNVKGKLSLWEFEGKETKGNG